MLNGLDYIILAIIAFSAVIGIWRGFVREALSLVVWGGAFWLAYAAAPILEVYLDGLMAERTLRLVAVFIAVFLAVHVVGFFVARLLSTIIKSIGLRAVDRVAGAGFGVLRGIVAIAAIILVAGMTPLRDEVFWQQAYLVAVVNLGLEWVQQYYPLFDFNSGILATAK